MQEEDSEWAPPSEAELKVINARRERSDKISKLMSEYLLKGYKMLATTCQKCMSIELKTREGEIYCVACSEVDCEETSKDNPLLNRQAAESQLRENSLGAAPKSLSRGGRSVCSEVCIGSTDHLILLIFSGDTMSDELELSIAALIGQMAKAREYLTASGGFDPASTRQCVAAMKECAECIVVLQSLKSGGS